MAKTSQAYNRVRQDGIGSYVV